jgi:hypothetical protein
MPCGASRTSLSDTPVASNIGFAIAAASRASIALRRPTARLQPSIDSNVIRTSRRMFDEAVHSRLLWQVEDRRAGKIIFLE